VSSKPIYTVYIGKKVLLKLMIFEPVCTNIG